MWGIRVQQQYNQLLDGTLGFADMEMSYWHHLSSLNTWWRWRGLDPSRRLHCSCSSLMAPLRDAYLTGLMRTFVTGITLLIRPPSAFSPFSSRAVFKSSVHPKRIGASISAASATAHTCSVTLMAMTETREHLEVAALAVPPPLGDVGHPSSEEVSLSICAAEVTRAAGPDLSQNTIYVHSRTDDNPNLFYACNYQDLWLPV